MLLGCQPLLFSFLCWRIMPGWGDSGQGLRVAWVRTPGLLAPEPRDSGPKKSPPEPWFRGASIDVRPRKHWGNPRGFTPGGSRSLCVLAEVEDRSVGLERAPDRIG